MEIDKPKIKETIAGNMKKYRAKTRLTQEQACEIAGLTLNYWQRLELTSQKDIPSVPTLFKIAHTLKVKPSQLIT